MFEIIGMAMCYIGGIGILVYLTVLITQIVIEQITKFKWVTISLKNRTKEIKYYLLFQEEIHKYIKDKGEMK